MRANITIAFLITAIMQVSASGYAQITINQKNTNLKTVFNQLAKQSGYDFIYDEATISLTKPLDVSLNNVSLEAALAYCFLNQPLSYKIEAGIVVIKSANPFEVKLQQQKITGKVYDDEGKILPGTTVQILGKTVLKLTTDKEGSFSFNSIATDTAIRVSFIGYKTQQIKLVPGKTNYKISLTITDASLKDVIITGVFDRPKESFTGVVTVITKEQIKMFGNRNLLKTIGNIDPSFDIQERNANGSNPNALPEIEIRGSSTIPADITQIQGTNVASTLNLPLFILDGFEITLERVMDMNQSDVESVVILKDASSTASYGPRGANGVVIITSIKPQTGKLRVSYSAGLNLEIADLSSYNLLNAEDKLLAEQKAGLYTSTNVYSQTSLDRIYNTNLKVVREGSGTDWTKVPVQTGVGQFHSLNVMGGDNKFSYILNGSYNQIIGGMKGSLRNNFNGGMTISYNMEKVRFSNNLSMGVNNAANSIYGDYSSYVKMNPYWSLTDDNGVYIKEYPLIDLTGKTQSNLAYNATLTDFNTTKYTVLRNTTSVDWEIFKGFKWTNSMGVSRQIGGSDNFQSPSNLDYTTSAVNLKGRYIQGNSLQQSYQGATRVSYGAVYGKHSVYAGANAQIRESKTTGTTIIVRGFLTDKFTDISYGSSYQGDRPTTIENTIRGVDFSGSVSYNYDSRFFVDANVSVNGGSSFGPDSRYGKFWSTGIGYTISNESFMKEKLPFINLLRIKGNYGVQGGLNFQPYDALTTYTYDRTVSYKSVLGATVTSFGNPDLSWQNTYQQSLALELGLFESRVTFNINTYVKKTSNAISAAYLSASHGFQSYVENVGKINNYGTDIYAGVTLIKDNRRQLNWTLNISTYHNRNLLVKLSDALKKANETYSGQSLSSGVLKEYREGHSIDEIYVLQSPGVDAATGKVLYMGTDGTISTTASGLQKVSMGNSQPKINGRISSMIRYKSFTANVGFGARLGGKKINTTLLSKVENAYVYVNVDRRVLDLRWSKPGDISQYKSLASTENTLANDRFVFTENTIMLNNVNLSYDLPKKWIKRLDMDRVGISASMSDLFYLSNIEQERGTAYPYSLKPSFTLSCTF